MDKKKLVINERVVKAYLKEYLPGNLNQVPDGMFLSLAETVKDCAKEWGKFLSEIDELSEKKTLLSIMYTLEKSKLQNLTSHLDSRIGNLLAISDELSPSEIRMILKGIANDDKSAEWVKSLILSMTCKIVLEGVYN